MVSTADSARPSEAVQAGIRRALVKIVLLFVVMSAVLFWCAGTPFWLWGWAFLFVVGVLQASTAYALSRHDPDLMAERSQLQSGTKKWDKWIAPMVALAAPFSMLILAALDYRWNWSPVLPVWTHIAGIAVALAGGLAVRWAMLSNHFFAATVRIQSERGHRVCDTGPYRIVRHPGYTAMILFNLAVPFIFGSLWIIPIAVLTILLLIVRTVLEDRTLAAELPGYAEYRTRVRRRLIPGIW